MSSAEITDSPQVRLMHSLVEGFRNKDMDHVAKLLHKEHRRITYPRSIGKPEQTKEEYLRHTGEVMGLWLDADPTVHSIIEAPGGKVVMHVTNRIKTSIGVNTDREMILIAHIVTDEDGSPKFKQIEEFTDSKAYLDFFKAISEAKANREHEPSFVA